MGAQRKPKRVHSQVIELNDDDDEELSRSPSPEISAQGSYNQTFDDLLNVSKHSSNP